MLMIALEEDEEGAILGTGQHWQAEQSASVCFTKQGCHPSFAAVNGSLQCDVLGPAGRLRPKGTS